MTPLSLEMAHALNAADTAKTTHLGAMLRLYRETRGLTLREAEAETGVEFVTLQRIETGKFCEPTTWLKLQLWMFGQTEELHETLKADSTITRTRRIQTSAATATSEATC